MGESERVRGRGQVSAASQTGPSIDQPRDESFVIRAGRPRVRTTFQLLASIHGGPDPQSLLRQARGIVLEWIGKKVGRPLATALAEGDTCIDELHGQHVEAVALDEGREWTLRYTRPDVPLPDQQAVAGRTWTTDLSLVAGEGCVQLAVRDRCSSTQDGGGPPQLFRPRFVKDLAAALDLRDVRRLEGSAWQIREEAELDALFDLLTDRSRRLPVVLLTEADQRRIGMATRPFLLDHEDLARRCQCRAHVVTMPAQLTFRWSERVGRVWSAFQGAVRTYHAGLDFDNDPLARHPLAMPEWILRFAQDGQTMEDAFTDHLCESLFAFSVTHEPEWTGFRFVPQARSLHAESMRRSAGGDDELADLYQQEIDRLGRQIQELREQSDTHQLDAIEAADARDLVVEENRALRARIDSLSAALRSGRLVAEAAEPWPTELDKIPDWANRNLMGSLVLAQRALRGLKSAEFRNAELLAKALHLLANEYRQMKMGAENAGELFQQRLESLNLRCTPSGGKTTIEKYHVDYHIKWPFEHSPWQTLGQHLRNKANTRDPRRCLAIYFFWDSDSLQVVVGWLPSHLPNDAA